MCSVIGLSSVDSAEEAVRRQEQQAAILSRRQHLIPTPISGASKDPNNVQALVSLTAGNAGTERQSPVESAGYAWSAKVGLPQGKPPRPEKKGQLDTEEKIGILLMACEGLSEDTAVKLLLHTDGSVAVCMSYIRMYVCMHACMYVHTYVQMYIRMYVYVRIYIMFCNDSWQMSVCVCVCVEEEEIIRNQ